MIAASVSSLRLSEIMCPYASNPTRTSWRFHHPRLRQHRVDPIDERAVAGRDPAEALQDHALIEGRDERDERVERHVDLVLVTSLLQCLGQHHSPLIGHRGYLIS